MTGIGVLPYLVVFYHDLWNRGCGLSSRHLS